MLISNSVIKFFFLCLNFWLKYFNLITTSFWTFLSIFRNLRKDQFNPFSTMKHVSLKSFLCFDYSTSADFFLGVFEVNWMKKEFIFSEWNIKFGCIALQNWFLKISKTSFEDALKQRRHTFSEKNPLNNVSIMQHLYEYLDIVTLNRIFFLTRVDFTIF